MFAKTTKESLNKRKKSKSKDEPTDQNINQTYHEDDDEEHLDKQYEIESS